MTPRPGIPLWALLELAQDAEDAAVDLGFGIGRYAEENYEIASAKLRRALMLAMEGR